METRRHDVTNETELDFVHMGPPLSEGRRRQCFAFGTVELGDKERPKIGAFVKERIAERNELRLLAKIAGEKWDSSMQYRIHPPDTPPSQDCNFWRFSCVGFVLAAYKSARINLLSESRPQKDLQQIKAMYQNPELDSPSFRAAMGIGEGSQWPVAFVGYVVNALARSPEEIRGNGTSPFQPVEGDQYFPSRREIPASIPSVGSSKNFKSDMGKDS